MDVMETLYTAYLSGMEISDLSPYFSDRLTKELGDARISPQIIASMGVDPMIGASDPVLTQLTIAAGEEVAERAVVEVSFHNRRVPVELKFELVRELVHGWQIDHLEGRSGDIEWNTRSIVSAVGRLTSPKKE